MFCVKCATKNPDDAKYCRKCGTKMPEMPEPDSPKSEFVKILKWAGFIVGGIVLLIIFIFLEVLSGI